MNTPRFRVMATAATVTLLITGCAFSPSHRDSIASAAPLSADDFKLETIAALADGRARREFLGWIATESQRNCQQFINRIVLEEGNANFYGDSTSTIFSALATVAKPINVVHGLTAGATIASGTKNAYLNGFFMKATIANFGDALQRTYNSAITQYLDDLPKLGDDMVVSVELGKIQSIHQLCSLASAEYVISQSLKPQAGSDISVTVDFDPRIQAKGKSSTLTVTLINGSGSQATLSDDMTVSFASLPPGFSIKDLNPAGSCTGNVTIAADGKSFAYAKGAAVPSGNCAIKLPLTLATEGTITVSVKAGALSTNQGTNSADLNQTLTFTPDGKPKKAVGGLGGAPAPAPPAPGPPKLSPVAVQSAPITPQGAANSATKPCRPRDIRANPCGS